MGLIKGLGKTLRRAGCRMLGRSSQVGLARTTRWRQAPRCLAALGAVPKFPPEMESQRGQSRLRDAQQPHNRVPLGLDVTSSPQGVVLHLLVCARAPTTGDGMPALHCKTFQGRVCWVTGVSNKQKKTMAEYGSWVQAPTRPRTGCVTWGLGRAVCRHILSAFVTQ